ncbi:MAG: hypothetical protein K2K06_01740 [Oscillospiraceae bacterium]|nr:hypothetical protein [Oscillospiraceae bacterium]
MQLVVEDKSWNRCARQVRRNRKITRTAENLHMTLLDRWDGTNTVQMSNTAIERELNCCHQSVINAKNRLVELGLVQIAERKNPTETTSFIIQPVLPPKRNCKASKPVSEKQSDTQPKKPKKVTAKKPSEPAKKKYGKNGRVRLTDEEFANLITDFGEEVVRDYIQRADNYSVEHNRWYKNNAETIRKWILEDKEKPKFKNKQAKKDKFTDEELQGYLSLVWKSSPEDLENLKKSEESCINKTECKEIEPPVRPIGYELTDEEIEAIENLHFETILNNSLHPLYYCTPGELMVLAEQWKKYKKLLL